MLQSGRLASERLKQSEQVSHSEWQIAIEILRRLLVGRIGNAAYFEGADAIEGRCAGAAAAFLRDAYRPSLGADFCRPRRVHHVLVTAGDGIEHNPEARYAGSGVAKSVQGSGISRKTWK
jgi:hypothetical protein